MIYFTTLYAVRDVEFSSFIFAGNRALADAIIKIRNIGEKIVGELVKTSDFNPSPLPSDFYLDRKLIECVHTLTFYGWVAGRSGVISNINDAMLRDDGLLHEVLHELHFPQSFPEVREHVLKGLVELEALIPGLTSYAGRPPRSRRGSDRRLSDRREPPVSRT